jgi:O-antigen/teichoic acid export membrane protein
MIIFMKNLDFRYEFAVDLLGKVAALIVVVVLGFATRSYWAIAAGTIVAPAVATTLSYTLAPLRPRLTLSEWPIFKDLVGWNGATQLIIAVSWQLDRLLLGRMIDLTTFGRYSVANDLSSIPQQALIQPLIRPLMAALANIRSPESLRRAYAEASGGILFVGTPIMVAIFSLADPVVQLGLGDKWAGSAPILALLSLSGLLLLPTATVPMVAMLMNRTHYVTIRVLLEFMIKLPVMVLGIIYFGIWGAIAARFVSAFVAVINSMILMRKLIGLPISTQLMVLFRPVASGLIMACAFRVLEHWRPPSDKTWLVVILALELGAGLLVYGLVDLILWRLQGAPSGVERYLLKRVQGLLAGRLEFRKE